MSKALAITFESTHLTMKANRVLKKDFNTEVIPAPLELSKSGCKIALYVPDIIFKEKIFQKLSENSISIKKTLEIPQKDFR